MAAKSIEETIKFPESIASGCTTHSVRQTLCDFSQHSFDIWVSHDLKMQNHDCVLIVRTKKIHSASSLLMTTPLDKCQGNALLFENKMRASAHEN
jgi:hypothetical protein